MNECLNDASILICFTFGKLQKLATMYIKYKLIIINFKE